MELREGDLVVHVNHGIARYRGMSLLEKDRQVEEHLILDFAEGAKLYVPSSKIGLVQKYVGGAKARPKLAKLGGRTWGRQKAAVEQAVTDMASDMLDLQAARSARPRNRFSTRHRVAAGIRRFVPLSRDGRSTGYDRCDQTGHGPAAADGPAPLRRCGLWQDGNGHACGFQGRGRRLPGGRSRTHHVLAEQHARTFAGRMSEYPFQIATLSRFATHKQQKEILEKLATGAIDIVIGTHRLAQADVRFHNLGLVIIDEEQRFGVEVKERLKSLRTIVDVLTMTATPIPRTLHMALLGLRDISNLQTPPEDRLAVETRVTRFDPAMIRNAVLRELNRDGQMFFVHNRVCDIENLATRLRQIVPEARLVIGHAQMAEHELERVMLDFVDRRFDILLSTTIVESGLDIPNANTIFIDEADRYGLADLHQLRGRVGRYKHRAYCYLLIDPNKYVTPNAARRLPRHRRVQRLGSRVRRGHAGPGDSGGRQHPGDPAERAHRVGRV